MCKSFNIEPFVEPLLRKLSPDQINDLFGKRKADSVAPGIDGVLNVVDVVLVDVCKNFAARLVYSAGKAAMAFLEDFVVVVEVRTGRISNRVYWQNRIIFSIFKGMVKLISDSLSSFGKFSESLAINCFDVGKVGIEDVEFKLCILCFHISC
ncbi:hypothetical protein P9112_003526 [Eukaryota sp. TZLM1-RC]